VDGHEAAAAEVPAAGMNDGERVSDGDRRVDRIATALEDLGADLRCDRLLGHDHVVLAHHGREEGRIRGRGDLQVTVKVSIPRKLSKDQRRLLEDLATSLPPEPAEPQPVGQGEDDKGLFDRVKDIFG